MCKKIFLIVLIFVVGTQVAFSTGNANDYRIPNSLVVCFDSKSINTSTGSITVTRTANNQVQIGLKSFDLLAVMYDFVEIERVIVVQDTTWKDTNGVYPMNIFNVILIDDDIIEQALDALTQCNDIIFAEYEGIVEMEYIPNDPLFPVSWHHEKIQSQDMWDITRDASEVIVAIVDVGVKWYHEDLKDNIYLCPIELPGVQINWETGEITGDGIDRDGNGKPNDVMGWNFYHGFSNPHNPWRTHGTNSAGVVGATVNNLTGGSGVAPNVKLLAVTTITNIYEYFDGIVYSAEKGAHIISCSWSVYRYNPNTANSVVNYATSQGALVVAAAGNMGWETLHFPAACDNALAIGATDQNDERAIYYPNSSSNYGTWIDVMAPGIDIWTTSFDLTNESDDYDLYAGTSSATPVVSGIAAMIKSMNPGFTPEEIKQRIISTTDPIQQNEPGGDHEGKLGSGRVNAFKAVSYNSISHNLTQSKIHWVSFPYLPDNSRQVDYILHNQNDNNLLSNDPFYIMGIAWNYGLDQDSIIWDIFTNQWANLNHQIDSRYGYKIQMTSTANREIIVSGYPPTRNGAEDLIILPGGSRAGDMEIWVGYFIPHTENALYALEEIEPRLYEIKTQRWAMNKLNGEWLMAVMPGPNPIQPQLNPGDMVSLKYIYHGNQANDESFRWKIRPQITNARYDYPEPIYFEFEEQFDYIPIYISLSDDLKNYMNAEIGLFIDNVCYGAEVVIGDTIQVNAYINEIEIDENSIVEFRYHEYSTRKQDQNITNYQVYDEVQNRYLPKNLNLSNKETFYLVSFLKDDTLPIGLLPDKTFLKGNYPNPFNPSTTISYSLHTESLVNISIYNIRGQLIKTIVNETKESGNHSVVWNGVDTHSNNVSSGIYFYKMETDQSIEVKKMLLMK